MDEQSQPLTADIDGAEDDCESFDRTHRSYSRQKSSFLQTAVIVMVTAVLSGLLGAYLGFKGVDFDSRCATYTTRYSPVLKHVDVKYATALFNGSFMQESIYRRPASQEVDVAWEALGVDYRAGVISESEGLKSGLSQHHVQRAKKYGGGYLVNVEGMHHLHCLNLVRKSLYFNYDYYKALGHHAFQNDDDILRLHVTHCLDTVRQVLMCNVDTGVLGQVWVNTDSPAAFPEFNTRHQCKNYDDVRQWADKLQAPPLDKLPPDYLAVPSADSVFPVIP